jgi:hypothetical protein
MKKIMRDSLLVAGIVIGLTLAGESANAEDPGTASTIQLPALTAAWWQWGLSLPASVNPLTDKTGRQCMVGQQGPTWYLAANLTGAPVTRACSVPGDKTLFFPVINSVGISAPKGVCGSTGPETPAQLRAGIKPFIDAAQNLSVKVDGQRLPKTLLHRVKSQVFAVAIPAQSILGGGPSCPASIFSPVVNDGYYVSLAPLGSGKHNINIQASSGKFIVDVTYNLTVVPVSLR